MKKRGIWLVVNHKAFIASDIYCGFTQPAEAMEYAKTLGWKEEINGSFAENLTIPQTFLDGKIHVTITFCIVQGDDL